MAKSPAQKTAVTRKRQPLRERPQRHVSRGLLVESQPRRARGKRLHKRQRLHKSLALQHVWQSRQKAVWRLRTHPRPPHEA
jgi:hypothetical protein